MILDQKTTGTLDQDRAVFILFPPQPTPKLYEDAIQTFETLDQVTYFGQTARVGQLLASHIGCVGVCVCVCR